MIQLTVGVRELKARLSHYLDQVEGGATLIITVRGKPVGRIVSMTQSLDERIKTLVDSGLIQWNGQRLRYRNRSLAREATGRWLIFS
jgi:prevent-host-death family protein